MLKHELQKVNYDLHLNVTNVRFILLNKSINNFNMFNKQNKGSLRRFQTLAQVPRNGMVEARNIYDE